MRENFWEKKTGRKGQVTPFIIIGIVIVVAVVLIVFFGKPRISRPSIVSTAQIDPVRDYVEECIEISLNDNLDKLDECGGYFTKDKENGYFYEDCGKVTFLVYNGLRQYNQDVENEIEEEIVNYLESEECSLDGFGEQFGNLIIEGKPESNVKIGLSNIQVNVKYPIRFEKGNILLKDFSLVYDTDFGAVYGLVDGVIDDYIVKGRLYGISDFNNNIFFNNYPGYENKISYKKNDDMEEGAVVIIKGGRCVIEGNSIDYKIFPLVYDDGREFRFGVTMARF